MHPLSITAAVGSLTGTVLTLTKTIGTLVATARNSRTELEAVSRELISLQVCLKVLENDRRNEVLLKDTLEISLNQVLVNIQVCRGQIESLLTKCKSNRLGRPIQWALRQKDEVNRLLSTLETHKTASQMTLQLNTISILTQETRKRPEIRHEPIQDDKNYAEIQRIGQCVDDTTRSQDQGPTLQRIEEALADLSESVKDVALKHPSIRSFSMDGCAFVADNVATLRYLEGITEVETRVQAMIQNPSINPFKDHSITSDRDEFEDADDQLRTAFCTVCAEFLNGTDSNEASAKVQQLQTHWRSEWLSQLKQELQSFIRRDDNDTRTTTSHDLSHGAILNDGELSDLFSETMSMTSWIDTGSGFTSSSARTVTSSRSSAHHSAKSEIRQPKTKYESATRRVKTLTEEISVAESEIASLRETHEQDLNRWKARLARLQAAPFENIAALQEEKEELKTSLDSAILDRTRLTDDNRRPSTFQKVNIELKNSLDFAQGRTAALEKDKQRLLEVQQKNENLEKGLVVATSKGSGMDKDSRQLQLFQQQFADFLGKLPPLEQSKAQQNKGLQLVREIPSISSPSKKPQFVPKSGYSLACCGDHEDRVKRTVRQFNIVQTFKMISICYHESCAVFFLADGFEKLIHCTIRRAHGTLWTQVDYHFGRDTNDTYREIIGKLLDKYLFGMSWILQHGPKLTLMSRAKQKLVGLDHSIDYWRADRVDFRIDVFWLAADFRMWLNETYGILVEEKHRLSIQLWSYETVSLTQRYSIQALLGTHAIANLDSRS